MVHIIPLFTDQHRPDPGNAAPPEAAAPPLDPYWQEVADHYARSIAQQQAFDTEIAACRLGGEIATAEADVAANAPADGEGLHHAMYGEVDPHTGRVVLKGRFDTLFDDFLKQAPPELAGLASRKPALREAGSVRMATQQLQRRAQYEQDHLAAAQAKAIGELAQESEESLNAKAPKLQAIYGGDGRWDDAIAKALHMPDTMPEAIRDMWKKNLKIAQDKKVTLTPQQFAEMFVDNNFAG